MASHVQNTLFILFQSVLWHPLCRVSYYILAMHICTYLVSLYVSIFIHNMGLVFVVLFPNVFLLHFRSRYLWKLLDKFWKRKKSFFGTPPPLSMRWPTEFYKELHFSLFFAHWFYYWNFTKISIKNCIYFLNYFGNLTFKCGSFVELSHQIIGCVGTWFDCVWNTWFEFRS